MSKYSWLKEGPESAPITKGDLDQLENYADRLFAKLNIDIEFTRHFLDRVNDERNKKQITMAELVRLFRQQYKKNGKKIAKLGPDAEAVMKDMQTDINMPFALVWDKNSQELDLVAKTVMRKKNFGTPNPVVSVESKVKKDPKEPGAYLLSFNNKEYKVSKFYDPESLRHKGEWTIHVKDNGEWEWEDTVYGYKTALDRIKSLNEAWSDKYKKSIDCSNPKGFSQKAHCAGRKKKAKESITEGRDADLYHTTDEDGIMGILSSGAIKPKIVYTDADRGAGEEVDIGPRISLTRDFDFDLYDFKLIIDQRKLAQTHKITPFTPEELRGMGGDSSEAEEYVQKPIPLNYIKAIYLEFEDDATDELIDLAKKANIPLVTGDRRNLEPIEEMSKSEYKKREKIVKGMKKNKDDFEKRYGKDAKAVMYATANKLAQEDVVGVQSGEHMINRVNKLADICAKMGNKPLLYRQFRGTATSGNLALVQKVVPRRRPEFTLGTGNDIQPYVLDKLGIKNPAFASMEPHGGTEGFFGTNFFMIPIGSYKIYSSPAVDDLGTHIPAPQDFDKVVASYKEGWPSAGFDNEVILDSEQYYLCNVGEFIKRYAGKKARAIYSRDDTVLKVRNDLDKELLKNRFKTYNDMAWYLRNPVTKILQIRYGINEDVEQDLNTQRGRLGYYLKQPKIKNDVGIHLGKLPKYHDGEDELAKLVPERKGVYALHPDSWEGTFYSLTNKDLKKIRSYQPAIVKIPGGSIVADMAIANQFYRTSDADEKQTLAKAYKDSIVPYGSDISHIKMPEIIMPSLIESLQEMGTITAQNATVDVKIGDEYANVKKFFKGKHKQKHLTQVESLEQKWNLLINEKLDALKEDHLESKLPQLSGYTKYTPSQLAIMEGGHTLDEEDPKLKDLREKLKGQLHESIEEELTEGFFSNLVVGTGIALAAFGAGSFLNKDISKPKDANEIVVVQQQEVKPGDTIYSLSRDLKIDPKVLYKLNGYDHTTELVAGDKIRIPDLNAKPTNIKKIPTNIMAKAVVPKPRPQPDIQPMTDKKIEKVLLASATQAGLKGDELAAFMAQCAHESNQFRTLVEYGGSLDFRKYDPYYAPKKARALGNTKRGDGAKYKGRGYIQITGKYNYKVVGKAIGVDLIANPEKAAEPEIAAKIALWYWKNRVAPKVKDFDNTKEVTKPINPGMRGIDQRIEYHDTYKKLAMAGLNKEKDTG